MARGVSLGSFDISRRVTIGGCEKFSARYVLRRNKIQSRGDSQCGASEEGYGMSERLEP